MSNISFTYKVIDTTLRSFDCCLLYVYLTELVCSLRSFCLKYIFKTLLLCVGSYAFFHSFFFTMNVYNVSTHMPWNIEGSEDHLWSWFSLPPFFRALSPALLPAHVLFDP